MALHIRSSSLNVVSIARTCCTNAWLVPKSVMFPNATSAMYSATLAVRRVAERWSALRVGRGGVDAMGGIFPGGADVIKMGGARMRDAGPRRGDERMTQAEPPAQELILRRT